MADLYDTNRFGELYYASRQPTSNHLFLAAQHLAHVFLNVGVAHAFLGGWTIRLRGGTRDTQDVDVTVETSMGALKRILLRMPRYVCFFVQIRGRRRISTMHALDIHTY